MIPEVKVNKVESGFRIVAAFARLMRKASRFTSTPAPELFTRLMEQKSGEEN